MKSSTLIALSLSVLLCRDSFVESALLKSNVPSKESSINVPTHIIKLKSSHISNITAFEPTAFIHKHYETFKKSNTLQGKKFDVNSQQTSTLRNQQNPSIKNVNIDKKFNTILGSFEPSFVAYLNQIQDDAIEYIEPNQIYKAAILPITSQPQPYVSEKLQKRGVITQTNVPSWGIARINKRSRDDLTTYSVDEASGNGIHVYVLDSGIYTNHPDFEGRAKVEANYIDYEDPTDFAGHGTHVAGTIGGNTYGVAKKVLIHGIKILDRNGDGTTSALIQAISHIVKTAVPGKSIINLSLTGPRSPTIDNALSMAVRDHGIPVFASAGNSGDDACDYSPSANPDVFTVGASSQNDFIPPFSSFGECVRLYAPGTNITSSWLDNASQSMDGTSMANPHVTGIAAMLMSEKEFHSPHELYETILSIATRNSLKSEKNVGNDMFLAYNGAERS